MQAIRLDSFFILIWSVSDSLVLIVTVIPYVAGFGCCEIIKADLVCPGDPNPVQITMK